MKDLNHQETVLYAFSVEPSQDQSTLERYLDQYPELADELLDLSFQLRIAETESPAPADAIPDPGLDDAWGAFTQCKTVESTSAQVEDVFAKFKKQAFAELAARLKVPRSILTALRDRLVEPTSVPEPFLYRLAQAVQFKPEAVKQYLGLSPAIVQAAEFKADNKPTQQGRVSFKQLVESTQMTDEEQQTLLQE